MRDTLKSGAAVTLGVGLLFLYSQVEVVLRRYPSTKPLLIVFDLIGLSALITIYGKRLNWLWKSAIVLWFFGLNLLLLFRGSYPGSKPICIVALSISMLTLFTVFYGKLFVAAHRLSEEKTKDMRRRNNQCINCGYSLTGNTSGRCPEMFSLL